MVGVATMPHDIVGMCAFEDICTYVPDSGTVPRHSGAESSY